MTLFLILFILLIWGGVRLDGHLKRKYQPHLFERPRVDIPRGARK